MVVLAIVIFIFLFIVTIYNRLIRLRNNRKQAFADIDVQLKQRHDLIPQLLESVKGYMKHEKGVLTEITDARSHAMKASTIDEKISAENRLSQALQGLNISVEAYPDLKASQNFMNLQEEISDIENKLASSRRFFNSATKELNNAVQVFPANMVAGLFGFKQENMYDLGAVDRETLDKAPEIKF